MASDCLLFVSYIITHPEPSADAPGVYLYYLDGTRPALFPSLFFAPYLLYLRVIML